MKITDIHINPKNPRIIKDDRFKKLVKSIEEFPKMMELRPIVIDNEGMVLGGNMRLKVLQHLKYKEIPDKWVKRAEELTEEEKKRFIVSDNVGFGEWDWDALANEWDVDLLNEWGMELPEDWVNPGALQAEEDDYQIPDEIHTDIVFGDLFEIGPHRLLCGDSTDSDQVARLMNGEISSLFATDPPYGVAYNDETGSGAKGIIQNDENDGEKLQAFLESCFKSWLPFLKKNAAWYLWHAQMTQGFFTAAAAAAAAAAVLIHRQIIWVKPSLIMGHGDYHWRHELCFYGWVKGNRPDWFGDRKQTTVWEMGRETDKHHPTAKPVEVFTKPIIFNTKPDMICAEPFAGSGTQFIAAHQLNRKCYGMEIDPKYCQVIIDRMRKLDPNIEIKKNGEPYNATSES